MFATAVRNADRDTTLSIASQTASNVMSSPRSIDSSSTPTAAAHVAASRDTRG